MKQSQKEAVFTAVTNVLAEEGIAITEGQAVNMTKERRARVNQILFDGFKAGSIELDRSFEDKELKAYVSGLQSNWLRKDKRLNGGVQYVAQNPGSRQGVGDSQLKNLRLLKATVTTEAEKEEIQGYIDARIKEDQASKAKAVEINYDVLPESLRNKFKK